MKIKAYFKNLKRTGPSVLCHFKTQTICRQNRQSAISTLELHCAVDRCWSSSHQIYYFGSLLTIQGPHMQL